MKLIGASVIITCDESFTIIKDGGILFDDENIIKIGKFDELKKSPKRATKKSTRGLVHERITIWIAYNLLPNASC